jgi:hypothetical protein
MAYFSFAAAISRGSGVNRTKLADFFADWKESPEEFAIVGGARDRCFLADGKLAAVHGTAASARLGVKADPDLALEEGSLSTCAGRFRISGSVWASSIPPPGGTRLKFGLTSHSKPIWFKTST